MSAKNVVNNKKDWTDFCDFIRENFLNPAEKQLKQETDVHRIFKLQGKISAYENIMNIRDTINGKDSG